jgi:HlyD family secretion protein
VPARNGWAESTCKRERTAGTGPDFALCLGQCYTRLVTEGLPVATAERLHIPDVQKRSRTQRLIGLGLVLIVGLGAFYLYRKRNEPVGELYRTVPITRRDLVRVIEATGHLDARARYEVPAPFAGRLTDVLVKPGDRVKRGEPLARLDDRAGGFTVRNASASKQAATWHMAEARSALDSSTADQTRMERLAARGLASNQELATAKSAVARAHATLEAARAEQDVAESSLASARFEHTLGEIVAPIDGIVLVAPDNIGSAVTPDRALFVVGEPLELMRVDVDVGEGDIGEVRVGQETSFEVQTFPGRRFQARVERLGVEPRREAGVVTYPVRLLADNPDRVLLPGMTASVKLEVARIKQALAVREAALRFVPPGQSASAEPRTRLYRRIGPAELEAVPVQSALSDGTYTQVSPAAGQRLSEGDEIAVGMLGPDASDRGQPGISLGGK